MRTCLGTSTGYNGTTALSRFVALRCFVWVTNVACDVTAERRGKPGQGRIRDKQPAPHPAVAGRVPSIYSVPRLTWLFSALRRVLYFAFGSYSLVPRAQESNAKVRR